MFMLKEAVWHNKGCENESVEYGYAITADAMNIKLVRLSISLEEDSYGKPTKSVLGYFTSIDNVLRKIYHTEVSLNSVEELVKANNKILSTIESCVASLGRLNTLRAKDLKGK